MHFLLLFALCLSAAGQPLPKEYRQLQQRLMKGWHTYNTTSVLSHVLMPQQFELKLGLKSNAIGSYGYLGDAYISAKVPRGETIEPVAYSADGGYTELLLHWEGTTVRVQSASNNTDIVLLVTPLKTPTLTPHLIVQGGLLWNAQGQVVKRGNRLVATAGGHTISVSATESEKGNPLPLSSPHLSLPLDKELAIYTGAARTLAEAKAVIAAKKEAHQKKLQTFQEEADVVQAIQNAIGWNTIYDPQYNRVITPVSRYWNEAFGGPFVLFDWDTYFGAYMAALFNKDLAFSNAIAITKSLTPNGFVPNYTAGGRKASFDRSQPPVGSMVVREIYRRYPEKWLLQYLFKDLLTWNRWWTKARATKNNLLCWGSDEKGDGSANTWQAAAYESGLDNSPMYDSVPFNTTTHRMELADVGLQSLYIMDCEALADIAIILGKTAEAKELQERAATFKAALATLWYEPSGMYLNKRTDTDQFSFTTSPTNFYPLLTDLPSAGQKERMVKNLLDTATFGGQYIFPSTPKNHPAFRQQDYWRGRIWGPLNLLVYLGVQRQGLSAVQKEIAEKSKALLMRNYQNTGGYIYENYNGISGKGREESERLVASDNFYHWGALLGFIQVIEKGHMAPPLLPLHKQKQ